MGSLTADGTHAAAACTAGAMTGPPPVYTSYEPVGSHGNQPGLYASDMRQQHNHGGGAGAVMAGHYSSPTAASLMTSQIVGTDSRGVPSNLNGFDGGHQHGTAHMSGTPPAQWGMSAAAAHVEAAAAGGYGHLLGGGGGGEQQSYSGIPGGANGGVDSHHHSPPGSSQAVPFYPWMGVVGRSLHTLYATLSWLRRNGGHNAVIKYIPLVAAALAHCLSIRLLLISALYHQ